MFLLCRFTARTLAVELAKRTRFLRDEVVALELREQEKQGKGDILGFYHAFKDYLIADLSLEQFADLYAQTVTHGMFAARTRTQSGFDHRSAFDRIPRTIGLLRDLFQYISYGQLPEPLAWMVDDIAEVLASEGVTLLDPAAGTMTFVAEAARVTAEEYESKYDWLDAHQLDTR